MVHIFLVEFVLGISGMFSYAEPATFSLVISTPKIYDHHEHDTIKLKNNVRKCLNSSSAHLQARPY